MSKVAPDPHGSSDADEHHKLSRAPSLFGVYDEDPLEKYVDDEVNIFTTSAPETNYLESPYNSMSPVKDTVDELPKNDIINFESIEYLCFEDEGQVELTAVRMGVILEELEVSWYSIDVSGNRTYEKRAGSIKFEKGQKKLIFPVECCAGGDNEFDVEALVDIALEIKDKTHAATLLGDVKRTRIVFLNRDPFPSGVLDLTNEAKVVRAFIKHNYIIFKKKVHRGILLNMVPGITFVVNQFITQYLLKTIGLATLQNSNKGEVESTHYNYIYMLGVAYLLNIFFSYYCEVQFTKLRLGGCVGLSLRSMAVDTVIQFSSEVEGFDVGRIIKTNERDVNVAIETSWLACFRLTGNLVKLAFMMFFLCLTSIDQARLAGEPSINALIIIPLVVIALERILLGLTFKKASHYNVAAMEADDIWSSFLAQLSSLRTSITNYRKGFMVTHEFERLYKAYNKANFGASYFALHTRWGATLIPSFGSALVMLVVGNQVIEGNIELSAFVVFLNTMNQFGPTLSALFMNFFDINKGYASIVKLAALLNADTRRKLLYRTQKSRKKLMAAYEASPKTIPWGFYDIVVHRVSYAFPLHKELVLSKISCRIEGGQVVAVAGGASVGKKCLLKLIARHFNPIEGGFIHYPSRWRVRYVDGGTCFFGGDLKEVQVAKQKGGDGLLKILKQSTGTLDYNLKFGVQHQIPENQDIWNEEIFELLKCLGMSHQLIGDNFNEYNNGTEAKKYTMIGLNGDRLSQTDRCLLILACTLLSSVDLLLMSNILDILGPIRGAHVLKVLKEFTKGRGLGDILKTEVNATPYHLRKRKTVIFSSKIQALTSLADNWVEFKSADFENDQSKISKVESTEENILQNPLQVGQKFQLGPLLDVKS